MLEPGDLIDIWVVEKALGTGGMGSVYRCHNRAARRILAAIKVLDPAVRNATGAEERFIREAEILYELDHPNIVKVRNIRIDTDMPYLEMEFVEGDSLERHLRRGALPFDHALRIMEQMADAIAYMHARGVCHRDIKPANVLIDPKGRVRIVDFGLALDSDRSRLTQQGMTFGTVSYAPPEWVTPDEMAPHMWDIYAAGVVFWEMLTGRVAFPVSGQGSMRQQAMQVILAKQDHPPLDPGKRFQHDVRTLIGRMTHSDPAQRFQSMAEALEAIRALVPQLAITPGETLTPIIPQRDIAPSSTWDGVDSSTADPAEESTAPPAQRPDTVDTLIRDRTARLGWLVLLAIPVLGFGVGIGIWRLGLLAPEPPPPTTRVVEVHVDLPEGVPVRTTVDGATLSPIDGALRLGEVHVGGVVVGWVVGEGCEACPGASCPAWCGVGSEAVEVPPGDGPLVARVAVPAPPRRAVEVRLPEVPEDMPARVVIGSTDATPTEDGAWSAPVRPGAHPVRVILGTCEDDAPCWPACPEGCAAWADTVVVPWSGDVPVVQPPVVAPIVATARAAPAPRPGGRFVTASQFAAWLAENPEHGRDEAIARGRADAAYLSDWVDGKPPGSGSQPMVNVTGLAAAAYCRGRGGLPSVDAELPPGGPELEFRVRDGQLVVLDPVAGVLPTDGTQSNVLTGFRCGG